MLGTEYDLNNFQIRRQCTTKYETKIQEALLIKKHNPKLNAQPYGGGSSILLNVFQMDSVIVTINLYCFIVYKLYV